MQMMQQQQENRGNEGLNDEEYDEEDPQQQQIFNPQYQLEEIQEVEENKYQEETPIKN